MTLSRSKYAERLAEFGDFVFAGDGASQQRGAWREFFRRRIGDRFDGRVMLEIGCYNAAFLADIAAAHPATAFVGLDWKCKQLYDGARQLVDRSIANVALLRTRAQDVASLFAPGEVDEAWVFHPEPCDEEPQRPNRLLAVPFLRDVRAMLREGGRLTLKTDHRDYYEWSLTTIGSQFDVSLASAHFWTDPAALAHAKDRLFAGRVTAYEQRFVKKNRPIYFIDALKR